jgi:hypothetical protein
VKPEAVPFLEGTGPRIKVCGVLLLFYKSNKDSTMPSVKERYCRIM